MKSLKSNLQERIAFLKLKAGDSEAFGFFYDRYVTNVYRFVLIKVSDKQVAEDITQEVFLKVWQHLVDKRDIRSFQAFIFRIARNTVIDHYRSSQRQELPLEDLPESTDTNENKDDRKLDKDIDTSRLLDNLKSLKAEYQEIILLRYVEDLSIDEISQIIEKDKRAVRVSLHRALKKLKEISQTN